MELPLKSPPQVGDVFRDLSEPFRKHYRMSPRQMKVFYALQNCRTAIMGGHIDKCNECGHIRIFYNSCRDRHCPKCQGIKTARWVDKLASDLLPVSYFHVVFTIPAQLNPLVLNNPRCLYNILFKATSQTILSLGKDPRFLGGLTGMIAVLHTWGQNLMLHPHLHCIIPAGAWNEDRAKWNPSSKKFFLPVRVISRLFKAKFLAFLKDEHASNSLLLNGKGGYLDSSTNFKSLINSLYEKPWIVYCKKPFKNTGHIITYLGRYSHRVAITNQRLLNADHNQVTFRIKDYKDHNRIKSLSLQPAEFIHRFLLHVLPDGFCKIRYYGLFACRNKPTILIHCKTVIGHSLTKSKLAGLNWMQMLWILTGWNLSVCPVCQKGSMIYAGELNTLRAPP
ncbi:MAG TPA: IS91 family transposase [Bacteroidales bacterium]|nr:IS91 family transposase [Bacteroidales bacterium]